MDSATVRLHNIQTDCQPQPGATAGAVARAFRAVEALKQALQLLVTHPGAAVGKAQQQGVIARDKLDKRSPAAVGVAQAVLQQVIK